VWMLCWSPGSSPCGGLQVVRGTKKREPTQAYVFDTRSEV
jgi:hypothetical protein